MARTSNIGNVETVAGMITELRIEGKREEAKAIMNVAELLLGESSYNHLLSEVLKNS